MPVRPDPDPSNSPGSTGPGLVRRLSALSWRAVIAVAGALTVAVILAILTLGLTGGTADLMAGRGGGASFGLALIPTVGLALSTLIGLVTGVSVIACLVSDVVSGRIPRLRAGIVRGWATVARVLLLGAAGLVAFVLTLPTWPLISAVALGRVGWRARNAQSRASSTHRPSQGAWLIIPFAASFAVLTALPHLWAALISGTRTRPAVHAAAALRLRARVTLGVGLGALAVASWLLGNVGVSAVAAAGADLGQFARGTAALGAVTAVLIGIAGTLLGLLLARVGGVPGLGDGAVRAREPFAIFDPSRLVATASLLVVAMLAPTAVGALGAAAVAGAGDGASGFDLVVTTVRDDQTVNPDDCVDSETACTLRGALTKAAARSALGDPTTIGFAVDGTIALSAPLELSPGTVLDGDGHRVVLDAGHQFGVIHVSTGVQEGGLVTLRGLTVNGGRSDNGGAGLFSDATRVSLEQMTFTDNVSGEARGDGNPDGGAVAVPYSRVSIVNSTFHDNHARAGVGGAVAAGNLVWTNSTAVDNTGVAGRPEGGAIYVRYSGQISHATVIEGGGVSGTESNDITVTNSAIDTPAGAGAFPCARITGAGDPDAPSVGNVDSVGTCLGTRAKLGPYGPLTDNGGPTHTVAWFPGSAAIGAGAAQACAGTDQRGHDRDAAHCDAGAFQTSLADTPVVAVALAADRTQVSVGQTVQLTATLTSQASIPAGTVRFTDAGDVVGTSSLDADDRAQLSLPAPAQGPHLLQAVFVPADGAPEAASTKVKLVVLAPSTVKVASTVPPDIGTRLHQWATFTATVTGQDDAAGVPAPTGTVTFTQGDPFAAGAEPVDVDLVDGVASWTVDLLENAHVTAVYHGDDYHAEGVDQRKVTTEDLPTQTTYTDLSSEVSYGTKVTFTAHVVDHASEPDAGPVRGRVKLILDGSFAYQAWLKDGAIPFAVTLEPGTHTLRVDYDPDDGWATSSSQEFSVTVVPAQATISVTSPAGVTWPSGMDVAYQATGVGPATIRLLEGSTVLDTVQVTLPGTGTFHVPYATLHSGTRTLHAQVVGSASTLAAVSDPVQVTVARAPSDILVNAAPMRVGETSEISVFANGGTEGGTVTLRYAGEPTVLATAEMDGQFGTLSFTPTRAAGQLQVTLTHPDGSDYLPVTRPVNATVMRTYAPAPTLTWSDVNVRPQTLTIAYPNPGLLDPDYPLAAPTGTITLHDTRYGIVGSAELVDGTAVITFHGPAGECYCNNRLSWSYTGDDTYVSTTGGYVSPVLIPGHPSTTVISALPETISHNGVVYLFARVNAPTSPWLPTGQVIFTVNGTDLAPVTVPAGDLARASYQTTGAGLLRIGARFVSASTAVADSVASEVSTTVSAVTPPVVELSTWEAPKVLQPFTMRVSVRYFTATPPLADGTTITIVDDDGHQVGTGRFVVDAFTARAEVQVTPAKGGPTTFAGYYRYGENENGTSQPFTVDVAAVPSRLTLSSGAASTMVGQPIRFTAGIDTSATPSLEHGPMSLQLHAAGVPVGDPVTLARGNDTVRFTVPAGDRGTVVYTVETTGDGASFGRGTGYTPVTVTGMPIQLFTGYAAVVHGRSYTPTLTYSDVSGVPAPTGRVWLELRGPDDGVYGCAFDLPERTCTIQTAHLPDGDYDGTLSYAGDRVYEPVTIRLNRTLMVYTTQTTIRAQLSPDPTAAHWVAGQQATITWRAHDPLDGDRLAVSGTVAATMNGAVLCSAPVKDGSCTFTVPTARKPFRDQDPTAIGVKFTSGTESLSSTYDELWTMPIRRCLPVEVRFDTFLSQGRSGDLPAVEGDPCTLPGQVLPGRTGFLEGTEVRVQFPTGLPTHYKATGWRMESNGRGRTVAAWPDVPMTFTVDEATQVFSILEYKPVCVTVTTGFENGWSNAWVFANWAKAKAFNPGWTDLKTESNCASPAGMSVTERADHANGIGHYAVGTEVSLEPHAYQLWGSESVANPQWLPLGVAGTSPADATHRYAHLTVSHDIFLYTKFRIAPSMCTPTRLYAGVGGKLSVASSTRAENLRYASEDGRCYTEDGRPGYLAGTDLAVSATPNSTGINRGHFVDRWLEPKDLSGFQNWARNLLDRTVSEYPSDKYLYTPRGWHFTVPMRKDTGYYTNGVANFGVSFAEVRCVEVKVSFRVLVESYEDRDVPKMTRTEPNCGPRVTGEGLGAAHPERGQRPDPEPWRRNYTGQLVREYGFTGHYTEGTRVTLSADQVSDTARDGGTRTLAWATSPTAAGTPQPAPQGPTLALEAEKNIWVSGSYAPDKCRTPRVVVRPANLGYDIDPDSFGACPDGKTDPSVTTHLRARHYPTMPDLEAIWSMGYQRAGDFREIVNQNGRVEIPNSAYVQGRDFFYNDVTAKQNAGENMVRLYYCARLEVGAYARGYDGAELNGEAKEAIFGDRYSYGYLNPRKMLANGGPCLAPLMGVPGTSVQVGLSGAGAAKWVYAGATLNGKELKDGVVPVVKVTADAATQDRLSIRLHPRCFTLTLGSKLKTSTAPNCPGVAADQRRYLPNTAVSLYFSGNEADTFYRINGADATSEKLAVVVMNRDRNVSADYHSASGLELAVRILTSVEQRIVSALVTAAMGVATGFLFVAQVASLAVVGLAEGLNALGVDGRVLDGMRDAANAVQAGIDVVNSLADCTQSWATGGGAPPFSPTNDLAARSVGVGGGLAGEALDQLENERASGAFGALSSAYDLTNMFATGIEGYLAEPAESWASIVDIGSCVADTGRAAGTAVVTVGR